MGDYLPDIQIQAGISDEIVEDGVQKDVSKLETLSWITYWFVGCAAVGGLLFGYDTGLVSGLLVLIKDDLGGHPLSRGQKEAITAVTSAFALVGALIAAGIADKLGRRPAIGLSYAVFILAAACMTVSRAVSTMLVGRAIVGLAVGVASTTVPVYIAEIAPSQYRGSLVTLNSVTTTGGQVLAYLVGIWCAHISHGWRLLVGLSALPALIFLGAIFFLPESPRYLIHIGEIERAERALVTLYPSANMAQIHRLLEVQMRSADSTGSESGQELEPLMTSPLLVGEVSQGDAKHTSPVWTPGTIRALVVACGVMASQQLCGFNSLMYYSATLFEDLGFADPVAIALVVALTNFVFTFVAVKYVDIVGRRDMLLQTMPLMELALFGLVYVFGGDPPSGKSIVVLIVCYVACYSSALGNVPWQGVELLPLPARALGSTAITATNWACNFLVSSTFLTLTEVVSAQGAFLIYSVFTALACVGVYFCYPDVSGLPLEAVQGIFDNGFIIRRT